MRRLPPEGVARPIHRQAAFTEQKPATCLAVMAGLDPAITGGACRTAVSSATGRPRRWQLIPSRVATPFHTDRCWLWIGGAECRPRPALDLAGEIREGRDCPLGNMAKPRGIDSLPPWNAIRVFSPRRQAHRDALPRTRRTGIGGLCDSARSRPPVCANDRRTACLIPGAILHCLLHPGQVDAAG